MLTFMLYPERQRCLTCGQEFPLTAEYWHRENGSRSGFRLDCKSCVSEQRRLRRAANPEKVREQQRRLRAANREKYLEYARLYRTANREEIREQARLYYATNREKMREQQRVVGHNRRAKKNNQPSFWSPTLESAMYDDWHCLCAYCGKQQGFDRNTKLSADHYIPVGAGEVCPGTVPWNMVPACVACNSSKSDTMPHDWLKQTFGARKGKQIAQRIEEYLLVMRARYEAEAQAAWAQGEGD